MLKSFLTTAIRHLFKNKSYASLNIFGLSIGLACFTLIALWVKDELSFDSFHKKSSRIYRIGGLFKDESGQFDQAVTCIPLAPALVNDLPEVEDALRIDVSDAVIQLGDKQFVEDDILGADPSFFNLFSFKLLQGDPVTALKEPYSIILSNSMAKKYFGDKDPIGESLKLFLYDPNQHGAEYKITGVIEDCPANSHFHYDFLISFKTIEAYSPDSFGYDGWFNNGYYTYILVKPDTRTDLLQNKLSNFLEKYIGKDMKKNKISWSYFLQPLSDIHLKSHLRYEIKPTTSESFILIFATIGFIVLLLACINYVNLSTAYSTNRYKEIGIRKVMGAYRNNLINQYLVESWLLAMLSLIVAIAWIELARPLFESLTGKQLANLYSASTLGFLLTIATLVGLLSGIYPSLVLSSLKTANVLKEQLGSGMTSAWLRKGLVVLQYSITIVLITGILVVQRQLKFIRDKDLGFNQNNLLIFNVNGSSEVASGYDAFFNDLLSNPSIAGAARSNSLLFGGLGNTVATIVDASGKKVNSTIYRNGVDQEYIDTYEMKLLAGRNFIKGSRADSVGFIINEATTKAYGYEDPRDAVGKEMNFGNTVGQIIGVVRDFHYNSLQYKIEPTCMHLWRRGYSRIAVRLKGNIAEAFETATATWKRHFPNTVLDYSFAEKRMEDQYQSEQRFYKIFFIFSAISLAIACLGLFSLVSYSVKSRTKEIGIRKVLGASTIGVTSLISKEFLLLILISFAIAVPVSYYFMLRWLTAFAYRISLEVETFLIGGVIAIFVALLTISIKSIQAALANPINSLRNE